MESSEDFLSFLPRCSLSILYLFVSSILSLIFHLLASVCCSVVSVMAEDNYLEDAEKAEEVGASIQGAILDQPANLDVGLAHRTSQANSSLFEETQVAQDDARGLEELAAVSTGPVYSAFSTGQKRFIVVMVSSLFFFQLSLPGLCSVLKCTGIVELCKTVRMRTWIVYQPLHGNVPPSIHSIIQPHFLRDFVKQSCLVNHFF